MNAKELDCRLAPLHLHVTIPNKSQTPEFVNKFNNFTIGEIPLGFLCFSEASSSFLVGCVRQMLKPHLQ
jgi:hypothetical protein